MTSALVNEAAEQRRTSGAPRPRGFGLRGTFRHAALATCLLKIDWSLAAAVAHGHLGNLERCFLCAALQRIARGRASASRTLGLVATGRAGARRL
jgi:hypothetical protein